MTDTTDITGPPETAAKTGIPTTGTRITGKLAQVSGYPDIPTSQGRRVEISGAHPHENLRPGDIIALDLGRKPGAPVYDGGPMCAVVVTSNEPADEAVYVTLPGPWRVIVMADLDGELLASGMPFLVPSHLMATVLVMVRAMPHQCRICRRVFTARVNVAHADLTADGQPKTELYGVCVDCGNMQNRTRRAHLGVAPDDGADNDGADTTADGDDDGRLTLALPPDRTVRVAPGTPGGPGKSHYPDTPTDARQAVVDAAAETVANAIAVGPQRTDTPPDDTPEETA